MIRKIAHTLTASAFTVDAVQMLQKPEKYAAEAKAVTGSLRKILPPNAAAAIPTDDATNVRLVAGTKAVASLLVATNKAPRLGALALAAIQIPTTATRNAFWNEQNKDKKKAAQLGFVTDLTLLGALLTTSMDTQGKPSVAWRVNKALPGKSEQEKMLADAQAQASEFAASAQQQAGDFFGTAREKVGELVDNVTEFVEDNKDDWIESAQQFRDQAVDKTAELKDQAADFGNTASAYAQEQRKVASKAYNKHSKQAKKDLAKARKQAKKDLKKARKRANI